MKIHNTKKMWILLHLDKYLFYSPNLGSNLGHTFFFHIVRYWVNYEGPEFVIKLNISMFLNGNSRKSNEKATEMQG